MEDERREPAGGSPPHAPSAELLEELHNFSEIARLLNPHPGETPRLKDIDIGGTSLPLHEPIGGDHLIYVDFGHRYDLEARALEAERKGRPAVAAKLRELHQRAGILVADVSGHRTTDAMIAAMVHQAFLLGVNYELDLFGEITPRVFEHLNTRLHRTTSILKYVTMLYGEITEGGRFRFISAGHRPPAVYSREYRRFMKISPGRLVSFPPLGMQPSSVDPEDRAEPSLMGYKERYEVNEINLLAAGDILLLYTDGLSDHDEGRYFPERLEALLGEVVDEPAAKICARITADLRQVAPPEDDITFVVIRRGQ